ncbi:MAG: poly-gamma-glutamate biosynthesis protein PgsC [Candidatus Cloacimonadota bacterium]|nr:poly-gamma-glutamate biosynthesis protein PgsC [Candidatus Cloacimonadota bacterium]
MIEAAVGLGVILSLIFMELLGASAGGIVVPGYIAMYLHIPSQILGTFIVSLITLFIIKLISKFTLLYGRRRMVMSILIGFILGWASRYLSIFGYSIFELNMNSIGYIIPGLIANWMEKQGIIRTISMTFIAAVIVRLIIIIATNGEVSFNV